MEGLRKAKSTSTVGAKSYLTISEMTESDREGSITPDVDKIDTTLQIITEPDDHSIKNSASSVVIEECDVSEREHKRPEFILDSAESSESVSQYLDKDDRGPHGDQPAEKSDDDKMEADKENKDNTTNRKRKLSAESSYSKISQTKSAIMQKLKDTKNKIKVPKFSLSVSKLKKNPQKKQKSSPPQTKKERRKSNGQKKDEKPVYIHIPLKPPADETEEFSDEKSKPQTKKPGSFKDLVRSMRQIKETKPIQEDTNEETLDLREDMGSSENINEEKLDLTEQEVDETPVIDESDKLKDHDLSEMKAADDIRMEVDQSESATDKKDEEEVKDSSKRDEDIETEAASDIKMEVDQSEVATDKKDEKDFKDNSKRDEGTVLTINDVDMKEQQPEIGDTPPIQEPSSIPTIEAGETPEKYELESESPGSREEAKEDVFEHLFKASSSRTEPKGDEHEPSTERPIRSRSAEPEKRRKLSLESSYSRKSLSKLGIMKKLRDASEKIKSTLTRSGSKASSKPKIVAELKKENKEPKNSKKLSPQKFPDPVYIHIPLKPPEGEEDEFSHLANEDDQTEKPPKPAEIETPSTPDSPLKGNDVQLIILTAPSDDEVLEYHSSDVPETPSSESGFFDKIDELKQLAKGAVEVVTTPKLESVTEENGSDKVALEGKTEDSKVEEEKQKTETMHDKVVDVEDGLSESKSRLPVELLDPKGVPEAVTAPDEINETEDKEIKSVLKTAGSPIMKKKVSFKRRSKTPKDGSYEDIQAPEPAGDPNKIEKLAQPSPTLDIKTTKSDVEDKSRLDAETVKTTSLEEDYNKWSKIR